MISRTAHVKRIILKNVVFSSNFQIGDAQYIDGTANVLAVTHDNDNCFNTEDVKKWENETNFAYKAPCPTIVESLNMTTYNRNPKICVNNVDVIAISTSAILQVGNTNHVRMASSVYFKRKVTQPKNPPLILKGE